MLDLFINYCKANPALTIVLIALAVFLIIVCSVIIVLSVKAKKAKKRLEKAEAEKALEDTNTIEETETPAIIEENAQPEPIEVQTEESVEESAEESVEEPEQDEADSVETVFIDTYEEEQISSSDETPSPSEAETVETVETETSDEETFDEETASVEEQEESVSADTEIDTEITEEIVEDCADEPILEPYELPPAPLYQAEETAETTEASVEMPVENTTEDPIIEETEDVAQATEEVVQVTESVEEITENTTKETAEGESEPQEKTEEAPIAQSATLEIPVTVTQAPPAPPAPPVVQSAPTVQPAPTAPIRQQPATAPVRQQPAPVKQPQATAPATREEKPLTAAERKELIRQQLIDKIVERLGKKPTQNKPAAPQTEKAPMETKPTEQKPVEQKPVEQKPVEQKPVEEKTLKDAMIRELKLIRSEEEIDDEMQIDLFDDPNFFTNGPKALLDELKDMDTSWDFYEEDETDQQARHHGKWVIFRVITEDKAPSKEELYFFELHAANNDTLFSSEEYTSYNAALRGIETHKANILRDNFKVVQNKKGEYVFKLLSGKNLLLCISDGFATKEECETNTKRMRRFARTAIIDENLQDHIIKVPYEDVRELPVPDGEGKWIIDATENEEGELTYFFGLYAPTGEKLLSGEDYTTYIGAVNGIQTFKANVASGNFRVTLTKRSDYVYKLLNRNGQLLYLGEHYRTKQACLTVVEAIKRFVKNAPVLTDQKLVDDTENS